ncbi:flavodoxin family protein [Virgibacillus salexigens]|uniref:Putative flavoprotein n=1 Tax=Virgibacillus massiliensis TaxID=1462526 RepID=A0A024Q656_9BACI|nr:MULTISPECIES: NAD(P)H-dependent oxidoreductase [Virgibacillus]MYL41219.1 flavodoxin family protein [Virgibacillus massiliensis]CDQ37973.1 putative flavoprotein [Virgibacillus massiliensis]
MTDVKAIFLNTSLKDSNEISNTDALYEEVKRIYQQEDVESETIRLADYHIPVGISDDLGDGDEWPLILEKVKKADILIIGSPIWLGEKSSLATVAMERLYGGSSLTNNKGQSIYYNKVAGVVITGNEDGAKNAATSLLYGLSHIGFVVPPNVDAYWVGEAGPGPSFIEANGEENEFTQSHVRMLAYNTMYLAKLLKENPIPAKGNVMA